MGSHACGGRGGIRTLETCYRLHDFQSCALGQTMRPFQVLVVRDPLELGGEGGIRTHGGY